MKTAAIKVVAAVLAVAALSAVAAFTTIAGFNRSDPFLVIMPLALILILVGGVCYLAGFHDGDEAGFNRGATARSEHGTYFKDHPYFKEHP